MEMKRMSFFDMKPFDPGEGRTREYKMFAVTVTKHTVNINTKLHVAMGEPKYVEVAFNEFGIKPVAQETKYSIKLTSHSTHHKWNAISRTAVPEKIEELLPFGRESNNLIISDGQFDEESGYWIFDIDSGLIVKRVKRK